MTHTMGPSFSSLFFPNTITEQAVETVNTFHTVSCHIKDGGRYLERGNNTICKSLLTSVERETMQNLTEQDKIVR